jgi:hypothetical protein
MGFECILPPKKILGQLVVSISGEDRLNTPTTKVLNNKNSAIRSIFLLRGGFLTT